MTNHDLNQWQINFVFKLRISKSQLFCVWVLKSKSGCLFYIHLSLNSNSADRCNNALTTASAHSKNQNISSTCNKLKNWNNLNPNLKLDCQVVLPNQEIRYVYLSKFHRRRKGRLKICFPNIKTSSVCSKPFIPLLTLFSAHKLSHTLHLKAFFHSLLAN